MAETKKLDTTDTKPCAITFEPFHYAVWQCKSTDHAAQRAKETYPNKRVVSINKVK